MYLKSVTLKNWRSYRAARFDFPAPRPQKKVMLVGAMNGYGKTSLLMALHLGLFGREAMQFVEGYRWDGGEKAKSYRQLLSRLIHRPALESDDPQVMVELEFVGREDESISITRTWNFRKGGIVRDIDDGDGEEIRISVNDRLLRHADWHEAGNIIASRLFPLHVMPCFFFDGEQAQARVEAAGGRAMSDAIRALYGMSLVEELDEGLGYYISSQRASLRREVGDIELTELDQKRGAYADLEVQVAASRRHREQLITRIEDAAREKNARLIELQQLGDEAFVDLDQLAKRKSDLQSQDRELKNKLTEGLASAALPLALRRRASSAERQLDAELIRDRWEVLKEETVPKVDRIISEALPKGDVPEVQPPLTEMQRHGLEQRLRVSLAALWSPPPTGCADEYRFRFLGQSERAATLQRLRAVRNTAGADIASLAADWQSVRLKLRDVQRQWETTSDVKPRTEALRNAFDEADARFQGFSNEKARLDTEERGLVAQLQDLAAAIRQMEERQTRRGPAEQKLEVAERVRSVFRDTRERLIPLCRSAIAEACTEHFSQMISVEYRKFRVDFDEQQQPILRGPSGEVVPVGGMSGAQKRAFGLAFTLAVAEASGEECPIVIDTPVGNMDADYRMRILKYLARQAPGQLIFLSHDEEISREYARELETYVAEKYLIEFTPMREGAGISTPRMGRYFSR